MPWMLPLVIVLAIIVIALFVYTQKQARNHAAWREKKEALVAQKRARLRQKRLEEEE